MQCRSSSVCLPALWKCSMLKQVDNSDNTALVGCIEGGRKSEHRNLVRNFVEWSGWNHLLHLNGRDVGWLPKEKKTGTVPINIMVVEVETLDRYRDSSTHLNDRLDWKTSSLAQIMWQLDKNVLRRMETSKCFSNVKFSKNINVMAIWEEKWVLCIFFSDCKQWSTSLS